MTLAQGCALPQSKTLTADALMDTPLPDLLAELGISLSVRLIEDPTFCGYIVARGDRVESVVVSSLWSDLVQDSMARAMLGVALRVPLPPLPEQFEVTEL
ncbi:hypothetical protein [Streptomyces mirabilis]|uniref:hypothetical protein n=1 Tax=Streptomyces mirabilis TaxID=68239 RepID=UPI0036463B5A